MPGAQGDKGPLGEPGQEGPRGDAVSIVFETNNLQYLKYFCSKATGTLLKVIPYLTFVIPYLTFVIPYLTFAFRT
jgi:hypothetical protein